MIAVLFSGAAAQTGDIADIQPRFRFAVIGDRTGAGAESWKIFLRAVDEVNRLEPDLTVFIGDIIEGAGDSRMALESQWKEAQVCLDSIRSPLIMVPGNHDIYNRLSYDFWKQKYGRTYYSVDCQGSRFIVLNTEERFGSGEEGLGQKQMAFFRREISNGGNRPLVILMHQPLWLVNDGMGAEWRQLEKLLDGRHYTVIAGHIHVLAAKREAGNLYLVQGPTGGKMRMGRNPALGFFQHFSWITMDERNVKVSFIEPGRIYGEDTAVKAYQRYVQGIHLLKY